MANNYVLGIDVGGTNCRLGVFEGHELLEEMRFEANFSTICKENEPLTARQEILMVLAEAIQSVFKRYPSIQSVGIGFPGFIDPVTSVIKTSPNLPGLKNINLAKDLSNTLGRMMGLHCKVVVENDANAAAYGEYCIADKPAGGVYLCWVGHGCRWRFSPQWETLYRSSWLCHGNRPHYYTS